MDALRASYGDSDSDSDFESSPATLDLCPPAESLPKPSPEPLPPPPLSLLSIPNSLGELDIPDLGQPCRVRNFPHVEGNYALHVFIPVRIPQATKKELAQFLKNISSQVPNLNVVDVDIPLNILCNDNERLEQVVLGREFHISLGRTVPIRLHQIDTVVSMLRQRLQSYKQYWINFDKWEVFVNDDHTRTFISMEVTSGGLHEITKQIRAVDIVYRLHNLPEFYKDPRPHISLAWALGDTCDLLQRVILQEMKKKASGGGFSQKRLFCVKFGDANEICWELEAPREEGNEYVKKGKKHYNKAIECYIKAINQNVLGDQETAILYSNRAHVNLLLGNNRRALEDAEHAIKLSPSIIKGYYRAAKAALSLNLLGEVKSYCEKGLEISPDNEELKKLATQVTVRLMEEERHKEEVSKALQSAQDLISAFEIRGLKMGKLMYRELTGLRKPYLDESGILHWPVLLLYAEVMSSDFIEDFCETDMFSPYLDMMFSESGEPLHWDKENAYTRDAVELYYEVGSEHPSSKSEILEHLLESTPASGAENISEENDSSSIKKFRGGGASKFFKVDQRRTLHSVLQEKDYVIPGIPVFYVVSKRTRFYKDFISGKWAPPALTMKEED